MGFFFLFATDLLWQIAQDSLTVNLTIFLIAISTFVAGAGCNLGFKNREFMLREFNSLSHILLSSN
jgi:hypothetical protein